MDALLADQFGQRGRLSLLPGDLDVNLRLDSPSGRYLVKIAATERTQDDIGLQVALLDHIAAAAPQLPVQRVVRTRDGAPFASLRLASGAYFVQVTTWLEGELLASVRPPSRTLHRDLGRRLADLDRALQSFDDARATRDLRWDLRRAGWIGEQLHAVASADLRALVVAAHARFVARIEPRLAQVRSSVIHGDANDHNVLVRRAADGGVQVAGLLDFGDACRSALIGEVAIAATYAAMTADDPLQAIDDVVSGYDAVLPLTDDELALVVPLIVTRCAVSITNAALQQRLRPDDPYVMVSQAGARMLLELLHDRCERVAEARLRLACDRPPAVVSSRVAAFLRTNAHDLSPVLPNVDVRRARVLDWSFDSLLTGDDPTTFAAGVAATRLANALAADKAGIGRYLEPRPIYTAPMFGGPAANARRRTVHLGIDVFAPAGTPVHAPLASTVHHVEVCGGELDYGGLVVLCHTLPDGSRFGTLYGHLDPDSIASLGIGASLAQGRRFAALGTREVNGGWPPHLHLQVLAADPTTLPRIPVGVADPDDTAAHAIVHPDPSPLLQLDDGRAVCRRDDPDSLVARRVRHFATNLRTSYRQPLTLVRGFRHFLFDRDGRRYLDAYNNVPHVGHCHPHVVRAVAAQTARLATNTRYLHDGMSRYAERLAALLPAELSVFFFTASGSEANELALRLVRAHTEAIDLCVMDHGYHGHTTGAMAISPYKFVQPGAPPKPDWVHVTVQPDVYRGPHAGADAGRLYAAEVRASLAALREQGRRLAGYLCECLPSVGGQQELPAGFLTGVYRAVRDAGGLCIADDVQTALWRTGSHAFGFARQEVVPDVLVLGKPLGNGFPLGAVVTTPAIADSFAAGPEFFSTFGGSTVAMAAGNAVLDVLAGEALAENAIDVGNRLLAGFCDMRARHAAIGDVRGRGFFLGVELVSDRATKAPATAIAHYVKNRLRERRILIGTDGPFDNVLKIRPPMTFDGAAADVLLEELDRVLGEDPARTG